MSITLTQPAIGSTDWGTAVNVNWQTLMDALNGGSQTLGYLTYAGLAAPAVSPTGLGRIYFDSTANKFKMSENGGAYANIGSGSVTAVTASSPLASSGGSAPDISLSGTVPVTNGGTGLSNLAQGDILYASASNTLSALAKNASSTRYLSNTGTNNNPAWAQVDLSTGVTNTLPVGSGGTGLSSLAQGDVLYASAANTLSALAKDVSSTRYLANTGTSNNPAWAQIDLASGVTGTMPIANLPAFNSFTDTDIALDDVIPIYDTSAAANRDISVVRLLGFGELALCQGRLTLSTGIPITTSDVTSATTIYFSPISGSRISLYDGTRWKLLTFSELFIKITDASQSGTLTNGNAIVTALSTTSQLVVGMEVTGTGIQSSTVINSIDSASQITLSKTATTSGSQALTFKLPADKNIDIFVYDNSGTVKLEYGPLWTNNTTRSTALTAQDGIFVKSGATTRRYLGTIRTTGTAGQTEDSNKRRYVWNLYNQVTRLLRTEESQSSWNSGTGWALIYSGNSDPKLRIVVGLVGYTCVHLHAILHAFASWSITFKVGIGKGSTTAVNWQSTYAYSGTSPASVLTPISAVLDEYPSLGFVEYWWLEYANASGYQFWGPNAFIGWVLG